MQKGKIGDMGWENSHTEAPKRHASGKKRIKLSNAAVYFVLAILSAVWLFPVLGIAAESFRCADPAGGAGAYRWGFDNYVRLISETMFLKWYGNTLLIGIAAAVVQTAFQLGTGYAFSRFRFRGRKFLMSLIFILGLFPGFLTLIAVNGWLRGWNLTGANAPYGSIAVYTASSAMGYSVAKGFFDTAGGSLGEAAQVDGASQLQIFFKIYPPLAKPIIRYTALMGFLMPWSDFSIVEAALPGYPVADGLRWILNGSRPDAFALFCAGGVLISVPIVILFLSLQKDYVAGETLRTTGRRQWSIE